MPNSPALWVAAGVLWIMDASINISMEPFRAFVGDNLTSEQRTTGFAMQSFLIGTGAVAASILPWLLTNQFGVANSAPPNVIPDSVRLSFYLGARGVLPRGALDRGALQGILAGGDGVVRGESGARGARASGADGRRARCPGPWASAARRRSC